ncbi:hypothetical protein NLJ89_g10331 [Agrocybe chaxingu]|uniref:Uncharacterized protein n=1 Tax=Agrocybe chaxingu TaxID=84603 RepID=A0A9W8JYD2_9AGAR|nr:hypothetical protein NLJ89_g10331 [Agrocybe chaxingu]
MSEILRRSCLIVSYSNITSMINYLAERSIERARIAACSTYALVYDNVNISTSIFVEQGPNATGKVQSGALAVIDELVNTHAEDMQLQPCFITFAKPFH